MAYKTGAESCVSPSSLYYIYGDGEENLYETIKKRLPLPPVYDEVFQTKSSLKKLVPPSCSVKVCETADSESCHKTPYMAVIVKRNCCCGWLNGVPRWGKIFVFSVSIIAILTTVYLSLVEGKTPFDVEDLLEGRSNMYKNGSSSTTTATSINTTNATSNQTPSPDGVGDWDTAVTQKPKNLGDYYSAKWYITTDDPIYSCTQWKLIKTVKIQYLQIKSEQCATKDGCGEYIQQYKVSTGSSTSFSFYIDEDGNIYGGRDWKCPYVSGELWVALLSDKIEPITPPGKKMLQHFNKDIIDYGKNCNYFDTGFQKEYV